MFDLRAVNAGGTFDIRHLTPNAQGQGRLGGNASCLIGWRLAKSARGLDAVQDAPRGRGKGWRGAYGGGARGGHPISRRAATIVVFDDGPGITMLGYRPVVPLVRARMNCDLRCSIYELSMREEHSTFNI